MFPVCAAARRFRSNNCTRSILPSSFDGSLKRLNAITPPGRLDMLLDAVHVARRRSPASCAPGSAAAHDQSIVHRDPQAGEHHDRRSSARSHHRLPPRARAETVQGAYGPGLRTVREPRGAIPPARVRLPTASAPRGRVTARDVPPVVPCWARSRRTTTSVSQPISHPRFHPWRRRADARARNKLD